MSGNDTIRVDDTPLSPKTTPSGSQEPSQQQQHQAPTQDTRQKRPNPQPRRLGDPERQPLLSPDDPGVSPLNVRNVKISKAILNINAFFTTIWFILILVSDFVSIPGFNNYGRSFLEINFIFISLFATLSSLLFFSVPSALERTLGYIISGILLLSFLLLLIFQRHSIGFLGSITCLWAILTNVLTSFSEYLVEKGKIHEEIRLTGRVETRRTLFEWVIVMVRNTLKAIILAYVSFIFLNIALSTFDNLRVKPWGELVSVEGDSLDLHIACYGDVHNKTKDSNQQPIVLLESGHGSVEEFSEWVEELFHLNQIERYCIYDRPGYGFSDSAPSPVSLSIVSDMLTEGLKKLKVRGPFTLVSHDIGGLYSRVFAWRNPEIVESMLLVESWHEDLLLRNPNANTKKDERIPSEISKMSATKGFKLWMRGFFSPLGLALQGSWLIKHRGSQQRIYGRDMSHQGRYLRSRLQEQISASILSYNEAVGAKQALKDIPISVVSSDYMIKKSLNWGNWQRELTKLSSTTKEWKIVSGGHEVWKNTKGKEQLQDVLLRLLET